MKPKYMLIKTFRDIGYLQELNRQFLHPLGLALEVIIDEEGNERLGKVWDSQDDPEGIIYGELDAEDIKKAQQIMALQRQKAEVRKEQLGFVIQPLDRKEQ